MESADIDALTTLAAGFRNQAGGDESYRVLRAAIAELRSLRARPVSCEACNGMAKRVAVLEEECRAGRSVQDRMDFLESHDAKDVAEVVALASHLSGLLNTYKAARLATDENGGV